MATQRRIGAGEFREQQRHQWDDVATGWRKWSDTIDTGPLWSASAWSTWPASSRAAASST